ncbi:uncharacterized protein LOC128394596 [Panonychus citri]|uniref:uncharacterized protein LOC128394596 n=1 Tax=Panonychus citri TaxID=50023 RepID=UPI002306E89B|nr:uncharacterized protein LOC128394596 [Panonychus citri]
MGVNCCSLKSWTTITVIYSIVNYIIFTGFDFLILLSIVSPSTLLIGDNQWQQFIESFPKIDNYSIIIGIILIRLILRLFIVIAVPILSIGNRSDRRKYLIPWELIVSIYIAALIASSVYFLIVENKNGLISEFPKWISANLVQLDVDTSVQWARFTIFLNLSDGGPLIVIWLILLCLVHLRSVQIRFEKSQLRRLGQWDTNILTYRIPRARLNSMDGHPMDSTLELRSSRIPVYPNIANPNVTDSHAPFYDNQAFKY